MTLESPAPDTLPTTLTDPDFAPISQSDEEDWDALLEDDEISNKIMEERMAHLKMQHNEAADWRAKGHGSYNEIAEEEFLKAVTQSKLAVVHFYHPEMPRCKIVDKHLEVRSRYPTIAFDSSLTWPSYLLQILAPKYIATKFVRIDASKAPFFVEKLDIMIMPFVGMFEDGKMCGRLDGLDMLGGSDDFETEIMECVIGASGAISYKPPEDGSSLHSIFSKARSDIVGLNKETAAETDSDDDE